MLKNVQGQKAFHLFHENQIVHIAHISLGQFLYLDELELIMALPHKEFLQEGEN